LNVLLLTAPKRPHLFQDLLAQPNGFRLGGKAFLTELVSPLQEAVHFSPGGGQVAGPVETVALLALFGDVGEDA
jgi:hypothetical protein